MRYVFFDEFEPGVLQEGRVYGIAGLLAEAGAHTTQELLEYLIVDTLTVNVTDEQKRTWSREIDQEVAQRVRTM